MINLCGVYHHDADGATAECTGLFGSLLSPRWMDALGMVVFHTDPYAFDPHRVVGIDDFEDVIGRHFKQPKEGLGFDNSSVAYMWRTMIWPRNSL